MDSPFRFGACCAEKWNHSTVKKYHFIGLLLLLLLSCIRCFFFTDFSVLLRSSESINSYFLLSFTLLKILMWTEQSILLYFFYYSDQWTTKRNRRISLLSNFCSFHGRRFCLSSSFLSSGLWLVFFLPCYLRRVLQAHQMNITRKNDSHNDGIAVSQTMFSTWRETI